MGGYNAFQDAHLGIVLGLGLLAVFLKRYAVSAVAFHLLLLALVIQWAVWIQQVALQRGQAVVLSINRYFLHFPLFLLLLHHPDLSASSWATSGPSRCW